MAAMQAELHKLREDLTSMREAKKKDEGGGGRKGSHSKSGI